MLTIGLDYRPALILRSGIGRYVANLVRYLPEVDEELQLSLFSVFWEQHHERVASAKLPSSERVELASAKFPGRILDFLGRFTPLSVETFSSKLQLFHFTDYVHPPVKTEPVVCTMFDTAYLRPEGFHSSENAKQLDSVARALMDRARVVFAVSETTKRDLIEHYKIEEERLIVTPMGVDEIFFEPEERPRQEPAVILAVGTIEPRKNIARLIRSFRVLRERKVEARLLIAGRKGWLCDDVFEELEKSEFAEDIHYLGEVSDNALAALMRQATVLAYPSLWEGFGMPVLEGMACGTAVLTSNRGSLKEVAGDAAHLIDPESDEEMIEGLQRLLEDDSYRADLVQRGRKRRDLFTWELCAQRTAEGYRRALGLSEDKV